MIRKILDGSPVLEILELYYFYGDTNRLRVSNASDKKMVLRQFWCASGTHRDGSNVQSLEILGCLRNRNYRAGDMSSLVDAPLDFDLQRFSSDDYERFLNIPKRTS